MMVRHITDFLKKFKYLHSTERIIKKQVRSSVKEIVDISLSENEIHIQNGNITITTSPTIKSEIFMNKEEIIQHLQSHLSRDVQRIISIR